MNGIFKNPRLVEEVWNLPKPTNPAKEESKILVRGQILKVDCDQKGFDFIPCFPKPGSDKTISRIMNGSWIIYLGMVEYHGISCMEFMTEDKEQSFYLGVGALPFLLNVPKRTLKKGHPFRKKPGSKIGYGSGIRRKKRRKTKKAKINLAKESLRKQPVMVEQKQEEEEVIVSIPKPRVKRKR